MKIAKCKLRVSHFSEGHCTLPTFARSLLHCHFQDYLWLHAFIEQIEI